MQKAKPMHSFFLGLLVSACLAVASLFGLVLRAHLPEHHLNAETRDVIRLATAVVGTLSALALGLLIASAKNNLDDAQMELRRSSASVVLLDRLLLQYGSEAEPSRILLRQFLDARLARGWVPASKVNGIGEDVLDLEVVQDSLRQLVPPSDEQLLLQKHMLAVSGQIAESHWLAMAQGDEGLPTPFITVLVFWLSFLFFTFGLQSPRKSTVTCILTVCAIAVGGAVYIVSDMANPFLGFIRVSSNPLHAAVARIDQN